MICKDPSNPYHSMFYSMSQTSICCSGGLRLACGSCMPSATLGLSGVAQGVSSYAWARTSVSLSLSRGCWCSAGFGERVPAAMCLSLRLAWVTHCREVLVTRGFPRAWGHPDHVPADLHAQPQYVGLQKLLLLFHPASRGTQAEVQLYELPLLQSSPSLGAGGAARGRHAAQLVPWQAWQPAWLSLGFGWAAEPGPSDLPVTVPSWPRSRVLDHSRSPSITRLPSFKLLPLWRGLARFYLPFAQIPVITFAAHGWCTALALQYGQQS